MKGLDRILSDQQADADGSEDEKKIKEKGDKLKQKLKKRHAQQLQDMCLEKEESKPEEIGDLQSVQSEFEGNDDCMQSTASSLVSDDQYANKLRKLKCKQQQELKGLDQILSNQKANADVSDDERILKEKGEEMKQKLKKKHSQQLQDMCLEKEECKPEEIGDLQSVQSEFEGNDDCKQSTASSLVSDDQYANKLRKLKRKQQQELKGLDQILTDQQANADGSDDERKLKEKGDEMKQKLMKKHAQQLDMSSSHPSAFTCSWLS